MRLCEVSIIRESQNLIEMEPDARGITVNDIFLAKLHNSFFKALKYGVKKFLCFFLIYKFLHDIVKVNFFIDQVFLELRSQSLKCRKQKSELHKS